MDIPLFNHMPANNITEFGKKSNREDDGHDDPRSFTRDPVEIFILPINMI